MHHAFSKSFTDWQCSVYKASINDNLILSIALCLFFPSHAASQSEVRQGHLERSLRDRLRGGAEIAIVDIHWEQT